MNWKYYNGDKTSCESTLGEAQVVTIHPKKIEYLKDLEPCREDPYYGLVLNKTLNLVQKRCTKPCMPNTSNYGYKLSMLLKQLPSMDKLNVLVMFSMMQMKILQSKPVQRSSIERLKQPLGKINQIKQLTYSGKNS